MFNLLFSTLLCATILQGVPTMTIQTTLCNPEKVIIIQDNQYYEVDDEQFKQYQEILQNLLKNSHDMPAFGVSLDQETKKAMQSGAWLQLTYPTAQEVNGLPFDTLLIELRPNDSGFNIIRGNNAIYDGRCFYIDLVDTTLTSLYKWANNLF